MTYIPSILLPPVGSTSPGTAPAVVDLSTILSPADPSSLVGLDNWWRLQHWLDTTHPTDSRRVVGLVPPGVFRFSKPLFVLSPGVVLRGQGRGVSTLMGTGWQPLIVTHPPAGWINPATRVDVSGVLDGSMRGAGFATLGQYAAIGLRNCTTLGRRRHHRPGTTFDSFRDLPGLTLEICFAPGPRGIRNGDVVCGIGHGDPYGFYRDGNGQYSLSFWTGDPTNPEVAYNHNIPINLDGIDPPYRLRAALDLDRWIAEATCNGRKVGSSILGLPRPGARLRAAWSGQPFSLGFGGPELARGAPTTDVIVYGLRLSGGFRGEPDSGRDSDRYTGLRDPLTLWYLPLTGSPGLTLDVQGGGANDAQTTSLIVLDGATELRGVGSSTLENLTIGFASPGLVIGQSLDVQVRDCEFSNGSCAVESLRTGAAYPITMTDCRVSGHDVPISLQTTLAYLDRVDILSFGGPCAVQTRGSNLTWRDSHVWFPGDQTQWHVDVRAGSYGGKTIVTNITVDDEDGSALFRRAFVRAEQAGSNPTSIEVSHIYATNSDPGAAVLELIAAATQSGRWAIPTVEARDLAIGGEAQYVARVRGDWAGTIDGSMAPSGLVDAVGPHHLTVIPPIQPDTTTP